MNLTTTQTEALRVAVAEECGLSPVRFRFSYPGQDNLICWVKRDSMEAADKARKLHIRWGVTEIEEFIDTTNLPNYTGSIDVIRAEVMKLSTKDQYRFHNELQRLAMEAPIDHRLTHQQPASIWCCAFLHLKNPNKLQAIISMS